MIGPENNYDKVNQASREHVRELLRYRARSLHEEAVRFERLADQVGCLDQLAEQALYDLVFFKR